MKRVRITELRRALSAYLQDVERGAEVEVTAHGRPIARIIPVPHAGTRLRIIPATRPFSEVRDIRYPRVRLPIDSTTLLLEERGRR
jgi:prevent-host-death family protein